MPGSQTRETVGFPSNQVKGWDWRFNPGCGGSGAGSCVLPASYSYIYWPVKVNPFSRRNNLLVLRDDFWLPFTNAGNDGLCPNSEGTRVAFDVLLFYEQPVGALDRSLATGIINVPAGGPLGGLPIILEFGEKQLPQPTHPDYERRIWVVIDLGATGYMTGGVAQTAEVMQTIKLDYEATP